MTYETANATFTYNPNTGNVYWKIATGNSTIGKQVTTLASNTKYYRVTLDGTEYMLHRVIYLIMTGEMPDIIDHINGDSLDNRWCNLRSVTQQVNLCNRKQMRSNTSGVTGVIWDKSRGKWKAVLSRKNLGRFDTFEEAVECRQRALTANTMYTDRHGQKDTND